jgi:hypothetical protein
MTLTFDAIDAGGKAAARAICNLEDWGWVFIQVITPGILRLGKDKDVLENPGPGGVAGGFAVIAPAVFHTRWRGPLWAIGSVGGVMAEIEVLSGPEHAEVSITDVPAKLMDYIIQPVAETTEAATAKAGYGLAWFAKALRYGGQRE